MDKTIRQTLPVTYRLIQEVALFSLGWYLWLLILNALTSGYVEQILPITAFGWIAGSLMILALVMTRQKPS